MEKKFVTFVRTEGNKEASVIINQIITVNQTLASDVSNAYCKIIEDKSGNYFVITKSTVSKYKKFEEVVNYLHPEVCEFNI